MPPARRKGVAKSTAAAAAKRWKVGDLVLAKVKGFSAWPATISDPKKWGYSADVKKVMVYFFGTKQIAFCSPADIEAFTEEKKQSLSTKLNGKGSDFVLAVKEIIESYEKVKEQEQLDEKTTFGSGENSLTHLQDSGDASVATVDSLSKNLVPSQDNELLGTVASAADEQVFLLGNKHVSYPHPSECTLIGEPNLSPYRSRKRAGVLQSEDSKRNISSSQQSHRLRSSAVQSNANSQGCVNMEVGTSKRNKHIERLHEASESDDVSSSALVSNSNSGDNASEFAMVDSKCIIMQEGSPVDSTRELQHSNTLAEFSGENVEASKSFDSGLKVVVVKKKRKPNRKRMANGSAKPHARLGSEAALKIGTQRICENSENSSVGLGGSSFEETGDQHLPLVKRASARKFEMTSPDKEDVNIILLADNHSLEEMRVNTSGQVSISSACHDQAHTNGESIVPKKASEKVFVSEIPNQNSACIPASGVSSEDKGVSESVSASMRCNHVSDGTHSWKIPDNLFGCSADDESILPPSKRFRRAMEAMKANLAEEVQFSTGLAPAMRKSTGKPCLPSVRCSPVTDRSKQSCALELDGRDSCVGILDDNHLKESTRPAKQEGTFEHSDESPKNSKRDQCKQAFLEPLGCAKGKDPGFDSCVIQSVVQCQSRDNSALDFSLVSTVDKSKAKICLSSISRSKSPKNEIEFSKHTQMDVECVSVSSILNDVPQQDGDPQCNSEHADCREELLVPQIGDSSRADSVCQVMKEIKKEQTPNSVTVLVSDNLSCDFPPRSSLHHRIFAAAGTNIVQNEDCCSLNILCHDKSTLDDLIDNEDRKTDRIVSKETHSVDKADHCVEASSVLSSFEAMLGSLTRTKESIGRATRLAMDCAKFGICAKVMELIAFNLEKESRLHKRVDIFFLVDSIAQRCQGLKSGYAGAYTSAIEAVLARLLLAAAPRGDKAQESRKQCLKVLRLWLERKILPDGVVRHHMKELDSIDALSHCSRSPSRIDRSLDDPLRNMEGMLVDEYGSNSSLQLPGFCLPSRIKDLDGCDSDGGDFDAVTPENRSENPGGQEKISTIEKHKHILKEIDGELEMEDVSPSCNDETRTVKSITEDHTVNTLQGQVGEQCPSVVAPLQQDLLPCLPQLPKVSSPPPPPPLSFPPLYSVSGSYSSSFGSKSYTSLHEGLHHSVGRSSAAPRNSSAILEDGIHYDDFGCKDVQMPKPTPVSTTFPSNFPVRRTNYVQQSEGPSSQHKPYPPRPPYSVPSNQFSYMQAGKSMKSRREAPQPYTHRYQFMPDSEERNFHDNYKRLRQVPKEYREEWRYPPSSFSGPRLAGKIKPFDLPGSYVDIPCESRRFQNERWAGPRNAINRRNLFPIKPDSADHLPLGARAPTMWWSR